MLLSYSCHIVVISLSYICHIPIIFQLYTCHRSVTFLIYFYYILIILSVILMLFLWSINHTVEFCVCLSECWCDVAGDWRTRIWCFEQCCFVSTGTGEGWCLLCPSVAGDLHRRKLHQARDSSKTNLWYFCHTPVICLLYSCHINVILLSYICHTPVVYMSYSCRIYVILLSYICHTPVIYMSYLQLLPFLSSCQPQQWQDSGQQSLCMAAAWNDAIHF